MTRRFAFLLAALVLVACDRTDDTPPDLDPAPLLDAAAEAPPPGPVDPVAPADPAKAPTVGDEHTFTAQLPEGVDQQLPDGALAGQEVMQPEQAIALAVAMLGAREQALGDGIVLFSGMGQHGVPIEPDDPDPALLEPGEPAIVVDPKSLDPGTTYADCLGMLQSCAMRTTTMDGCVDAAPVCATAEPWLRREYCCPAGAMDAYRAARADGTPWAAAFLDTVIDGIEHFPGLTQVYEEGGLR